MEPRLLRTGANLDHPLLRGFSPTVVANARSRSTAWCWEGWAGSGRKVSKETSANRGGGTRSSRSRSRATRGSRSHRWTGTAQPYDACMDLPVMPPVLPMLAKSVKGIPDPAKHGGLSFEPKWDGVRCILFRDGDEGELASRNTQPLTRYFPDIATAAREQLPPRCGLDGEIFV